MDGSTSDEGRVEVCVNGEWWTVCRSSGWGEQESKVVCRQLGYNPLCKRTIVYDCRDKLIDLSFLCQGLSLTQDLVITRYLF